MLSDYPQARALEAIRVFERAKVYLNQALAYQAPESSEPLLVLLFQDPQEIRSRSANPMSVCTFMVQTPGALHRRPLILAAGDDTQIMRLHWVHELTHYELFRRFGALPAWLDEGLASYFSSIEDHGDQIFLGTPQRLWRFVEDDKGMRTKKEWTHKRTEVPRAWLLDASELIDTSYDQFHTSMSKHKTQRSAHTDEAINYAESWLLIHMLLHGPERYQTLWQDTITSTQDPLKWGEKLVQRLRHLPENQLDRDLSRYAKKIATPATPIHMPSYPRPQIRIERLSPTQAIEARALATVKPDSFLAELRRTMQNTTPSIQAFRTRAWMELGADRPIEAGRWLCQAKALAKQSPNQSPKQQARLLHLGLWIDLEMRRARKTLTCLDSRDKGPTAWANALSQVANNGQQWHAIAQIYGAYGKYQDALIAGQRAVNLDPTCWSCYESLAQLFYRTGQPQRALALQHNAIDWTPDALGAPYLRKQQRDLAQYAQLVNSTQPSKRK